MKKRIGIAAAVLIALPAMLTSCTEKDPGGNSHSAHDTDSSYYGVNYTDTGDSGDHFGNSTANVDHSAVNSMEADKRDADVSSNSGQSSAEVSPAVDSRRTGSTTPTKTIITYYYYDEDGEHATDTEIYTDIDNSSEDTSEAASSLLSVSSDTETDASTDSEVILIDNEGSFDESDLTFSFNETKLVFDCDIEEIVKSIGEPLNIDIVPNPDNPDIERMIYNYEHFSIETEPAEDGASYKTTGLQIFDDSVQTEKGVHIGMKAQDAVNVYGPDMMICGEEYRYYIGSRYMYLYIANDVVANIGYANDNDMTTQSNNSLEVE